MEEGREVGRRLEVVVDEVGERKKKKRVGKGKREFSKEGGMGNMFKNVIM